MELQQTITVRIPDLPFPTQIDPTIIEGQPELSFLLVGISLTLPYLEPFLIRTMNEAKRHIDDPVLLEQIKLLNAQEGQHYRLHASFNKAIGQTFPELVALEDELEADCRRFEATRSLKWRLAYVETLERFTVAFSLFMLEEQVLRGARLPAVRDLYEWHQVEEIEHRSVAFDVCERLYGDSPYRLAVCLYTQWHFLRFVFRAAGLMLAHDRAQGRDHGTPAQVRRRVLPVIGQFARGLLPKVLASYSSRYQPSKLSTTANIAAVLQRIAAYDTRTGASPRRPRH